MKLLSKIGLVALMAIAPLTHAANQDAGSAIASLAADLNKIERDLREKISSPESNELTFAQVNKLLDEYLNQKEELIRECLTKFIRDIEQGKIPQNVVNNKITLIQNKFYSTLLSEATKLQDLNLVKRLIKLGAQSDLPGALEINGTMRDTTTPIMMAIRAGNHPMVTELLKNTKNINQISNDSTALMCAANEHDPLITQQLIDAGADLSIEDSEGMTALDIARDRMQVLKASQGTAKEIKRAHRVVKILERAQAKK